MPYTPFEKAFQPDSIAIVGVSRQLKPDNSPLKGLNLPDGIETLNNIINIGFKGRLYPVNPQADSILGLRAYPSVSSLPETVDLVIVTVPNNLVPDVLEDCIKAGALNVHIMTSGFGETGQEDDKILEKRVREIAVRGKLRLIGPNCIGLQVPSARITTMGILPQKPGTTAFVSQSGGHVLMMLTKLANANLGFSKMISFGNAIILDSTDFIEYLSTDPDTEIITAYMEGVKDGRRLLDIVGRANTTKPVIIWKAGLSDSGARAAASHTGALGGQRQLWDAFFKQTKAIQVHNHDELVDMITTFLYLKSVRGNAAAVLSMGGGSSVAGADVCAANGINIPPLSQSSTKQLLQRIPLVNRGVANPLDVYDTVVQPSLIEKILDIMVKDPVIDFVIINYPAFLLDNNERNSKIIDSICRFARNNTTGKPIVYAVNTFISVDLLSATGQGLLTGLLSQKLFQSGVPVYASLESACRSMSRFLKYKRFQDQLQ